MAVEGRIESFALGHVLQVLHLRRVSGLVEVAGDRTCGSIRLNMGVPVNAQTVGGHMGERALMALLENTEGSFSFHPDGVNAQASGGDPQDGPQAPLLDTPSTEAISRSLDSMLLEIAEKRWAECRGESL